MRNIVLAMLAVLSMTAFPACNPGPEKPEKREKAIQSIYTTVLKEKGGIEGWTLTYHPMIYAVWQFKSRGRANQTVEQLLRKGNVVFWALQDDVAKQSAEGLVTLNRQRFLALIPDGAVREETSKLIDSGVPAIHAFARAYMQSIIPANTDLPQQILIELGKLYTGRPELIEVPSGESIESADTRWRDWLHDALAGCGLAGVLTILDFDHQIEDMQKYVEAKFWDGRLSIAYNLRSIQLARAQALEPIFQELEPYRAGGQVTGLDDWMYYNLGFTLHSGGGLFPYSQDEIKKIGDFIQKGLVQGPLGDGEEAKAIADALGRTPSMEEAARLFGIIDDAILPCERHQLGYLGLAKMFQVPIETWAGDATSQQWLRSRVISEMEKGVLSCGNGPLFKFYEGVLSGFTRQTGQGYPGNLFSDSELVHVHELFVGQLPQFKTADDRGSALYLLRWGLVQPPFMMKHPELGKYRATFLQICTDWSNSTTFDNSKITPDDFEALLKDFKDSLGQ